ncbi:MAG: hypothetical protein K6E57_03380 [Fibrobacter sp.]|nr:hypothetical protein [Fibrobacter sp.]
MLKKMCLTLCLTAFLAWAQDDEFDDSDFVSAGNSAPAAEAPSASKSDDDEFDDAEDSYVSRSKKDDMAARKKFEEDQRADEYANSLRRRDWLKDRLMLEIGMGARAPFMGETGMGMGFGAGAEYITRWHIGLYGSFGFLPKGTDNDFDDIELEGGTGYKVGLNFYLFPKNPLHLGLSASYGTVYFDHDVKPEDGLRPLIKVNGFQFDALITYLTNEWYFLQFSVGMYYAPELGKAKEENISYTYDKIHKEYVSRVVNPDGMSKTGIVFGIMIGYALPELFPDDTEKRRREREKERERSSK